MIVSKANAVLLIFDYFLFYTQPEGSLLIATNNNAVSSEENVSRRSAAEIIGSLRRRMRLAGLPNSTKISFFVDSGFGQIAPVDRNGSVIVGIIPVRLSSQEEATEMIQFLDNMYNPTSYWNDRSGEVKPIDWPMVIVYVLLALLFASFVYQIYEGNYLGRVQNWFAHPFGF